MLLLGVELLVRVKGNVDERSMLGVFQPAEAAELNSKTTVAGGGAKGRGGELGGTGGGKGGCI